MNPISYIFGIICAASILAILIDQLRRGRLRERHAIWWILGGMFGLAISIFPQLLDDLTKLLGVEIPLNLMFFVSIGLLFLIHIQMSAELTSLEARNRTLAEEVALLKLRVTTVENRINS